MLKIVKIKTVKDQVETIDINQQHQETEVEVPISIKPHHSFFLRLKGLMFRKHPLVQEGIWLSPCNSIHMFFMRFAIDVVFLDRNQTIVHLAENVQPWKVIPAVKEAYSVLELPTGAIRTYSFQTGNRLEFSCQSNNN